MTSKNCAVITGGAGSLAQALTTVLTSPEWSVAAPSRTDLDVTDLSAIKQFFDDRFVDLLVCAAGMSDDSLLLRFTEHSWDQTWAVNFTGAAACAAAVLPNMVARNCGHIVLISSHSAIHPLLGQVAYASAKAALLGLVADLAQDHGKSNIRINAVIPGFLETQMTRNVSEKRRSEILQDHQLNRFNTCDAVARFIRHLHFELPHTSGQVFQLDSRRSFWP